MCVRVCVSPRFASPCGSLPSVGVHRWSCQRRWEWSPVSAPPLGSKSSPGWDPPCRGWNRSCGCLEDNSALFKEKKKVKSCLTSSPYAWWIHAVLSALQLWGFCTAVCVVINVIPSTDIYFLSPLLLHSVCPSRLGGLGELGRVAGVSLSHNHLHWHCTADSELPDRLMCLFLDCGEEVGLTEVKPCRCRENKPNSRQEGPKSLMWFVLEWTAARLSCTVA